VGAINPAGFGDLLQYGGPGVSFALNLLLIGACGYLLRRNDRNRDALTAQKDAAVKAEAERWAADVKRLQRQVKNLADENERLEQQLDHERARRRAAEDRRP